MVALANPWGRGLSATLGFVASSRGPPGAGCRAHGPLPAGRLHGGPLWTPDGGLLGCNVMRLDGGFVLATATDAETRERIEGSSPPSAAATARWAWRSPRPRVAKRLRRSVGLDERDGLLVRGVEADSAAFGAGIRQGDLIVAVGDSPIASGRRSAGPARDDGDELAVTILRGIEEHTLTARLEP